MTSTLSIRSAVATGTRTLLSRPWTIVLASAAFLVPTEFAYGVLDIDRGWRGAFEFADVVAAIVFAVGGGLAWVAATRVFRGSGAAEAATWAARHAYGGAVLSLAVCTAFVAGLIVLIVPGLIILTRWSLGWAAFADTDLSWRAALGRSDLLLRGHGWRMFALLVVLSTIYLVVDYGVYHAVEGATGSAVAAFSAAAAIELVTFPLQASILFAAYEQLRPTLGPTD